MRDALRRFQELSETNRNHTIAKTEISACAPQRLSSLFFTQGKENCLYLPRKQKFNVWLTSAEAQTAHPAVFFGKALQSRQPVLRFESVWTNAYSCPPQGISAHPLSKRWLSWRRWEWFGRPRVSARESPASHGVHPYRASSYPSESTNTFLNRDS